MDSADTVPLELLHDRMIEAVFAQIEDCAALFQQHEPRRLREFDARDGGVLDSLEYLEPTARRTTPNGSTKLPDTVAQLTDSSQD